MGNKQLGQRGQTIYKILWGWAVVGRQDETVKILNQGGETELWLRMESSEKRMEERKWEGQ